MFPVIPTIIFAVIGAIIGIWWLRRMAARSEQSMRERFPDAKSVVGGALFYGQESRGKMQARGTGTLAVTDGEIIFERWLPKAEYRVRIADITSVATPRSFLGKTNGRPLLCVNFTTLNGQSDAMAWLISDLDGVKSQIESLRG